MQSEIEEVIRQNPHLCIRDIIERYRVQCRQAVESISRENTDKIEDYFRKLCQKKYGQGSTVRLADFSAGAIANGSQQ